jgi:hypothetical protein
MFMRREEWCRLWEWKRDDERKRPRDPLSYIHSNQWNAQTGETINPYPLKPQKGISEPSTQIMTPSIKRNPHRSEEIPISLLLPP